MDVGMHGYGTCRCGHGYGHECGHAQTWVLVHVNMNVHMCASRVAPRRHPRRVCDVARGLPLDCQRQQVRLEGVAHVPQRRAGHGQCDRKVSLATPLFLSLSTLSPADHTAIVSPPVPPPPHCAPTATAATLPPLPRCPHCHHCHHFPRCHHCLTATTATLVMWSPVAVIDRMSSYFGMRIQATRFNWYKDSAGEGANGMDGWL